jgi:hypothetical protein
MRPYHIHITLSCIQLGDVSYVAIVGHFTCINWYDLAKLLECKSVVSSWPHGGDKPGTCELVVMVQQLVNVTW